MSSPWSVPTRSQAIGSANETTPAAAHSFVSSSPIAQASLARDLADWSDEDSEIEEDAVPKDSESSDFDPLGRPGPTLYRRPSGVTLGARRPIIAPTAL